MVDECELYSNFLTIENCFYELVNKNKLTNLIHNFNFIENKLYDFENLNNDVLNMIKQTFRTIGDYCDPNDPNLNTALNNMNDYIDDVISVNFAVERMNSPTKRILFAKYAPGHNSISDPDLVRIHIDGHRVNNK